MNIKSLFKAQDLQTKILLKNSSWIFSSNLIRAALLFVRGMLVARGLGVELFGTFNLIAAFATVSIQLLLFPISSTVVKYGADLLSASKLRELVALVKGSLLVNFLLALLSIGLILILTLFFYDVFLDVPGLETLVLLFAVVGATVFFDELGRPLLRLQFKFKAEAMVVIASAVLDIILISASLYLFPQNFKIFFITVLITKLISSFLLNSVSFFYIKKLLWDYRKTPIKVLRPKAKELKNYTLANSGSRILKTLMNNGDLLLLGALSGPVSVAFYNIAKKLAQMIMIVIDPLTSSIFPQFSTLIAKRRFLEVITMIKKTSKIVVIPTILFLVVMVLFGEEIIIIAYGMEFSEAFKPFLVLAINAIISALLFWNRPLLESINLVKFRFQLNVITLIAGAFVAYFTISKYGALGAALGLLVANGFASVISAIVSFVKTKRSY